MSDRITDKEFEQYGRYAEAVKALILLIVDLETISPPTRVEVHVWGEGDHGFRIAELTLVWKRPNGESGASFMQDEPGAADLLFAAERFVLHYGTPPVTPPGWESAIDIAEEAKERFIEAYEK